jgi:hypothetical protein
MDIPDPKIFDSVVRMSFAIKQSLWEGEDGPEVPALIRQIEDPAHMRAGAIEWVRGMLIEHGEARPRLVVFSRHKMALTIFQQAPETRGEQAELAASIAVMLRTSPAEAYWMSWEAWAARGSKDPAVNARRVADREDRREGVMMISASARGGHLCQWLDTIRDDTGKVSDLRLADEVLGFGSSPITENLFDPSWILSA